MKYRAIGISHPNYPLVRCGAKHGSLNDEFSAQEVNWDGRLEDVFDFSSPKATRWIVWDEAGKIVMDCEVNEGDDMMDELLDEDY